MEQQLPSLDGRSNTGAYVRYRIEDRSYFNIIKKDIAKSAEAMGFSAEKIGRLQIVVAELASNLLKFGLRNREFLWKPVHFEGMDGIEMLTLDKGSGIASISEVMEDGFSTSGTAGEGLGAIQRQSDFFELYSQAGQGTVALARLFVDDQNVSQGGQPQHFAAFSVAKPGEKLCGDGYFFEYAPGEDVFNLLILDGLGHGEGAHEAALAAIEAYKVLPKDSPSQVLREIHQRIKQTRGGVGMVLKYNFEEQVLSYCGVGNIAGKTISYLQTKNLTSFNGIVGHVMSSRVHDYEIPWERGSLLLLHSDGLNSRWDISKYAHIQKHDPAILAACLYRDHSRGNDDVTIVISKYPNADGKSAKANH
jgi:anti-sigma regulatory factor (Ser/Thr protein kinase)